MKSQTHLLTHTGDVTHFLKDAILFLYFEYQVIQVSVASRQLILPQVVSLLNVTLLSFFNFGF
jgi:hypothetical protein